MPGAIFSIFWVYWVDFCGFIHITLVHAEIPPHQLSTAELVISTLVTIATVLAGTDSQLFSALCRRLIFLNSSLLLGNLPTLPQGNRHDVHDDGLFPNKETQPNSSAFSTQAYSANRITGPWKWHNHLLMIKPVAIIRVMMLRLHCVAMLSHTETAVSLSLTYLFYCY